MEKLIRVFARIGVVLFLVGCQRSQKAKVDIATAPPPSQAASPLPSGLPPGHAATTPHPAGAEVEMFGRLSAPKTGGVKGRRVVYVADNDCLAPDAHVLGTVDVKAPTGDFFIEVTPKWGSDLTICAAIEPKPGEAATLYGKLDRTIHAEQEGEIVVRGFTITLERKPPHKFPAVASSAAP
jgi:hypothetical protein